MADAIPGLDLENFIRQNILLQDAGHRQDAFLKDLHALLKEEIDDCHEWLKRVSALCSGMFYDKEGCSRAFFAVALQLDDAGLSQEAIFFYRLSLLALPNPKAFNNLALLYIDLEQEDTARAILDQGHGLFPGDRTIADNLALIDDDLA